MSCRVSTCFDSVLFFEVAEIFKAVLPAYAGAFKTVEFAILDKDCLPEGNFQIFRSSILGASPKLVLQPRNASIRKIVMCEKLCPKFGGCLDRSEDHQRNYWHPEMCPDPDCTEVGDHTLLWRHQQFCPDPNCKIVFGPKGTRTALAGFLKISAICFGSQVRSRQDIQRPLSDLQAQKALPRPELL